MTNPQSALCVLSVAPETWGVDWVWGMPLVVLIVVIHVACLGLTQRISSGIMQRRHPLFVVGITTLLTAALHAMEAWIWALAYLLLGALPDGRSAMLYSLNAITAYGHPNLFLENRWQLLGAIEALNGWLLFGLTTAFLFGMLQKVGLVGRGREGGAA